MKNNILAGFVAQVAQPAPKVERKNVVETAQPLPQGTMNVISRAYGIEAGWEKWVSDELGYERKTTFMSDFVIGELVSGEHGIRDTFKRAFAEWKNDMTYLTEMYLVLTHRCSMIFKENVKLAEVYQQLSEKIYDWVYASDKDGKPKNVSQEFVDYFFQTTD